MPPGALLMNGEPGDPASDNKSVYLPGNRVKEALAFYEHALVQQGWTVQRVTAYAGRNPGGEIRVDFQRPQPAPAVLPNGQPNYALKATRSDGVVFGVEVVRRWWPDVRTWIHLTSYRASAGDLRRT